MEAGRTVLVCCPVVGWKRSFSLLSCGGGWKNSFSLLSCGGDWKSSFSLLSCGGDWKSSPSSHELMHFNASSFSAYDGTVYALQRFRLSQYNLCARIVHVTCFKIVTQKSL